jgi:hypothetical protein
MRSFLWLVALLMMAAPSRALDRTFEISVENSLKGSVPSNWFLRASWRGETLVVFVSPPASESFKIWYDTDRQKSMLEDLCKALPHAIWNKISSGQDIAMEQVVGGNGGKGSWQFSCRAYLSNGKAEASVRSN